MDTVESNILAKRIEAAIEKLTDSHEMIGQWQLTKASGSVRGGDYLECATHFRSQAEDIAYEIGKQMVNSIIREKRKKGEIPVDLCGF